MLTCRVAVLLVYGVVAHAAGTIDSQKQQYDAEAPKTILELQQFRRSTSIVTKSSTGIAGTATLINLNPAINVWYVLTLAWGNGSPASSFHLENSKPRELNLALDQKYPAGLSFTGTAGKYSCSLFNTGTPNALENARTSQLIYVPLCEGRVYLRNPSKGNRTAIESATEFVRDQVWGGERVIMLVHHLLADKEREIAPEKTGAQKGQPVSSDAPAPPSLDPQYSGRLISSGNLGITLDKVSDGNSSLVPGAWYPAAGNPGIYVSVLQPSFVSASILQSYKSVVNSMDRVESSSLCYLIAYEIDNFELGYGLGTDHPRVGWSFRIPPAMKNQLLPGPDGIGTIAPLVATGLIGPEEGRRTVSTFTGGFKRDHSAMKYGELANRNHGTHYGVIENGVVFSKLQPGLATVFVREDNTIELKTWTTDDDKQLNCIRHARQNGVPLIDLDPKTHEYAPGPLVNRWGPGNWSGSEDQQLRTLRAGLAIQVNHGKRYLIYGVFSDATPSSMARVFQAYGVQYAMPMDMNALEHTYLALYRRVGSQIYIDHLLKGMSQIDKNANGEVIPRFLGYPDNRDFFFLMRRSGKAAKK